MQRTETYKQTLDILTNQDTPPVDMGWLLSQYMLHQKEFDQLIKLRIDVGNRWFDLMQEVYPPQIIALFDSFINDEQGI